jgi:hypothetical protein
MADNFGERPATEAEVTAWKALVKAGKAASRGLRRWDKEKDKALPRPRS